MLTAINFEELPQKNLPSSWPAPLIWPLRWPLQRATQSGHDLGFSHYEIAMTSMAKDIPAVGVDSMAFVVGFYKLRSVGLLASEIFVPCYFN
jgi:hypothetical protein